MLNLLSQLKIIDNTGAKSGITIKRLKPKTSTKNSYATVGDILSFSVRKTINQNKIKRKKVYQALIVRTKKRGNMIKSNKSQKLGAHSIRYDDNAGVLIKINNKEYIPLGSRIKGPICKSLKLQEGCLKITSIAFAR
jgi:large subunit ribosomal protein L14